MKMIVEIINKANYKNYFTAKLCMYTHTVKWTCILKMNIMGVEASKSRSAFSS